MVNRIEYAPNTVSARAKGNVDNGQHAGTHKKPTYLHNGLYFMHGLGCIKWADCFTCPFDKCTWQSGNGRNAQS